MDAAPARLDGVARARLYGECPELVVPDHVARHVDHCLVDAAWSLEVDSPGSPKTGC